MIDDTKNEPEQRAVSQPGDKGLADMLCSPRVLGPIPALVLLKHFVHLKKKKLNPTNNKILENQWALFQLSHPAGLPPCTCCLWGAGRAKGEILDSQPRQELSPAISIRLSWLGQPHDHHCWVTAPDQGGQTRLSWSSPRKPIGCDHAGMLGLPGMATTACRDPAQQVWRCSTRCTTLPSVSWDAVQSCCHPLYQG